MTKTACRAAAIGLLLAGCLIAGCAASGGGQGTPTRPAEPCGCGVSSSGGASGGTDLARQERYRRTYNTQGMDIRIAADSDVTRGEIDGILKARGATRGDIWFVDRAEGRIRIIKDRKDGTVYPPGAGVEFWHYDSKKKSWVADMTA